MSEVRSPPAAHLVIYVRAYCHLCDDMVAAVTAVQSSHGFTLGIVDVDADPLLEARYDELVPVLALNGVEICHHFFDHERLAKALADQAWRAAIC